MDGSASHSNKSKCVESTTSVQVWHDFGTMSQNKTRQDLEAEAAKRNSIHSLLFTHVLFQRWLVKMSADKKAYGLFLHTKIFRLGCQFISMVCWWKRSLIQVCDWPWVVKKKKNSVQKFRRSQKIFGLADKILMTNMSKLVLWRFLRDRQMSRFAWRCIINMTNFGVIKWVKRNDGGGGGGVDVTVISNHFQTEKMF